MEQNKITDRRKAIGLSITGLAAYLGVSQQYMSQLEHGNRNASEEKLKEIDGVLTKLELAAQMVPKIPRKKKQSEA